MPRKAATDSTTLELSVTEAALLARALGKGANAVHIVGQQDATYNDGMTADYLTLMAERVRGLANGHGTNGHGQ